jgi:hypothetical protein
MGAATIRRKPQSVVTALNLIADTLAAGKRNETVGAAILQRRNGPVATSVHQDRLA